MSSDADQRGNDGSGRSSTGAGSTAELRQDVVSGNFTLVNPARAGRPTTVARPTMVRPGRAPVVPRGDAPHADPDCPFCWGNEQSTATELLRVGPGAPGSPGWRIRVVRNRYPVLGGTDEATGRCEVVVFRDHDRRLEDMEVDEVAEILDVVRSRLAVEALTARTSVQVFVNVEAVAGASIAHPHAQIIALDFVPQALALEFDTMARLGADPLQRDLELADEHDLVISDGAITAWSPWGTTSPFAVRIAPRVPGPAFVDLDAAAVAAVARTLRDTLRAMNDLLEQPAYNVVVFLDQRRGPLVRRWRLEVVPKVSFGGGFEIGTGVTTHAAEARATADALRRHLVRDDETPVKKLSWLPN